MLLNREDEEKVEKIVEAVAIALGVYLIGRDIIGRQITRGMEMGVDLSATTLLEDAFIAGKAVQVLGEAQVKTMTAQQLRTWASMYTTMTPAENAALSAIREDTVKWLAGRSEVWKQDIRKTLAKANKEYKATVETTAVVDAEVIANLRTAAKLQLIGELRNIGKRMTSDADKVVQTEMAAYFQQGQISQMTGETEVYKVPRPTACKHCFRLHLNPEGSPRIYKLSEVLGNANEGMPAYAWMFTIGPVHPYCYCLLRTVEGQPPAGKNDALAFLRKQALAPRKKS